MSVLSLSNQFKDNTGIQRRDVSVEVMRALFIVLLNIPAVAFEPTAPIQWISLGRHWAAHCRNQATL